jgi:chromosomal replication initiation ATPase DnaA
MYLLRQENGCSLAQVGALLGNRDPSSVTNACKKLSAELSNNKSLKRRLVEIQKIIKSGTKQRTP